jgi:hypothetical protein
MTQDPAVEEIVHRHAKAIVSMDIAQIMHDLEPEAMVKLQQEAGGGTAVQINDYEVMGSSQDGDDYLYDVRYIGPQTFTVRARWSRLGSEWKIVDAGIIARE